MRFKDRTLGSVEVMHRPNTQVINRNKRPLLSLPYTLVTQADVVVAAAQTGTSPAHSMCGFVMKLKRQWRAHRTESELHTSHGIEATVESTSD